MYAKTHKAKNDYHMMVTNLLKEHIETRRIRKEYKAMCMERRQWYDQAKHDTMRQYAAPKMSLVSYERFAGLRTDTTLLLTRHTQQALNTLLQQERNKQFAQETAKTYRLKASLHWDASRQPQQTIYFIRKRP